MFISFFTDTVVVGSVSVVNSMRNIYFKKKIQNLAFVYPMCLNPLVQFSIMGMSRPGKSVMPPINIFCDEV